MPNLYKIQTRDNPESEWHDMKPIKGWFDHIDLTYSDACAVVREYKGLSGTKDYRTIKQGKNDTIMPCTVCGKSIKILESYGSCDGGISHIHDKCHYEQLMKKS